MTYASPYWIVRYPHQKRYKTAEERIMRATPRRLLDYGAGDGKLLCDLLDKGLTSEVVAYEPVQLFQERLAAKAASRGLGGKIKVITDRAELEGPFDFISCLGVLEHMPLPEREAFYALCDSTLADDGTILIDVPVEVGPTLAVKAAGRMLLKGRDAEYRWSELLRYSLGARMFDPGRFDPTDTRTWIHFHGGFDYRLFSDELENRFEVFERTPTPVASLPAWLFNQEIFLSATHRGPARPDR